MIKLCYSILALWGVFCPKARPYLNPALPLCSKVNFKVTLVTHDIVYTGCGVSCRPSSHERAAHFGAFLGEERRQDDVWWRRVVEVAAEIES